MSHKYLDEIGITERADNNWGKGKDKRESKFKKQRKIYGFDERDTWNLKSTFYEWLYEHIKMYIEIGGAQVDLTYHKFKYKNKKYNQQEILDIILSNLEYIMKNYGAFEPAVINELTNRKTEAMELWDIVLPAMWW